MTVWTLPWILEDILGSASSLNVLSPELVFVTGPDERRGGGIQTAKSDDDTFLISAGSIWMRRILCTPVSPHTIGRPSAEMELLKTFTYFSDSPPSVLKHCTTF
jgi:hypothetical protein